MKLEAILETLGEEDETYPTILAALKKSQAQERPVSDRIVATKSFLLRAQKRVEHAAQVAVKAREALEEALASQAKEEGLLADGQRRLERSWPILAKPTLAKPTLANFLTDFGQTDFGQF